jgi:hypothetical protein
MKKNSNLIGRGAIERNVLNISKTKLTAEIAVCATALAELKTKLPVVAAAVAIPVADLPLKIFLAQFQSFNALVATYAAIAAPICPAI